MAFLKNLFGKKQAADDRPVPRISVAPGQSQEEQDENRSRMEAELNASRTARDARKTEVKEEAPPKE